MTGFLGATTITTIHYLATKAVGKKQAQKEIEKLFTLFEITPVNDIVLHRAIRSNLPDFEDAVLDESAKYTNLSGIVTRDHKGFKGSFLTVYSPEELLNLLNLTKKVVNEF